MNKTLRSVALATVACLATALTATADAESKALAYPAALSVFPTLEFPTAENDVLGLRLGLLVSEHRDVSMLDLNVLAGFTTRREMGIQLSGIYNRVGEAYGLLQIGGIANDCRGDFIGGQVSALYNNCEGNVYGLSVAAMDMAKTLNGLQVGLVTRAKSLEGIQIGLVNFAEESEGIQIGLVNVMLDGKYPVFPIINLGFWR